MPSFACYDNIFDVLPTGGMTMDLRAGVRDVQSKECYSRYLDRVGYVVVLVPLRYGKMLTICKITSECLVYHLDFPSRCHLSRLQSVMSKP
jgi:hypothetical protein